MTDTSISGLVTSRDGTRLAVHDLGGKGQPLLIAHATGFHARAYRPFTELLTSDFHVIGYDARSHGESDAPPVDQAGKPRLDPLDFAGDVLSVVDALGLEDPVGFGHSAGASALVLAEEEQPATFAALYCFEPVIVPSDDPPPHDPDNPLSRRARLRRRTFPSLQAAYDNYASKPPLALLAPGALRAYVELGFEAGPEGAVQLCCEPEHEALMYAQGLTHHAFCRLGDLSCPVTLACGETTDAIGPDILASLAARMPQCQVEVLPGLGHFGPLEDPQAVAASVLASFGRRRQR